MIHLVLAVVFNHSSTPHLSVLVHSSLFFTVFLSQFFIYQSDITVACFVLVVYLNSASPKSISSSTVLYFSFVLCFLLLFFPSFFYTPPSIIISIHPLIPPSFSSWGWVIRYRLPRWETLSLPHPSIHSLIGSIICFYPSILLLYIRPNTLTAISIKLFAYFLSLICCKKCPCPYLD